MAEIMKKNTVGLVIKTGGHELTGTPQGMTYDMHQYTVLIEHTIMTKETEQMNFIIQPDSILVPVDLPARGAYFT